MCVCVYHRDPPGGKGAGGWGTILPEIGLIKSLLWASSPYPPKGPYECMYVCMYVCACVRARACVRVRACACAWLCGCVGV